MNVKRSLCDLYLKTIIVTVIHNWLMWLPQSTHCSAHRRTRQWSDMTGHRIHPQRTAGPPAGKHPLRPGEHWGRTQWSMCPSLGHTCNTIVGLFMYYGFYVEYVLINMNLKRTIVPSQLNETPCLPSLITDVCMVSSFSSQRDRLKLKAHFFLGCGSWRLLGPLRAGLNREGRCGWFILFFSPCWPLRWGQWKHTLWFSFTDFWIVKLFNCS